MLRWGSRKNRKSQPENEYEKQMKKHTEESRERGKKTTGKAVAAAQEIFFVRQFGD